MQLDANLFASVRQLAIDAGQEIMRVYGGEFAISAKDDQTPVTEADLAAHRLIEQGLRALNPAWPVLSEEGTNIPYAVRRTWKNYWLVDPLDGTREFIKRNGEFSVNIALIDGHDAVLGVVHAPALGVTYAAMRGAGAWKWLPGEEQPQPIRARVPSPRPLRVALSRSHANARMQSYLDAMQHQWGDYACQHMGSAIKSCLVAEGTADVYPRLGLTSEWDTAAAQCVVEEAGAYMQDTSGQRMLYNAKDSLLNPEFLVFADTQLDWISAVPPISA